VKRGVAQHSDERRGKIPPLHAARVPVRFVWTAQFTPLMELMPVVPRWAESVAESGVDMQSIVRLSHYALIAGIFLASGCVVEPDYDHDRAYRHHSAEAEYREHERREAYRHCREAGERDCDDLLRHD
jgi:hypothetical protein